MRRRKSINGVAPKRPTTPRAIKAIRNTEFISEFKHADGSASWLSG
jgi:hypothetical protein